LKALRGRLGKVRIRADVRTTSHGMRHLVSAITFDVGGTLIECWPSVGHVYAEVAARHGFVVSPSFLNRRFKAAWQAFQNFRHTRSQWAELVDLTFGSLLEPPPSQTFFPELYRRFSEPDAWHVYEDVLPTLQLLKSRGLKLGIVSNWDDRLRPLLRHLNLDVYFETVVVSCEIGACKPAPELFAAACAALGCAPENTLHVGDSLEMDLRGAQSAGLQARQVRRGIEHPSVSELGSLRELDKL
jgi:putative hydrolase of the HAD superfamily